MARETFGVQHVVARIYDSKRAEVYERMGIPSVATVPWTVNRLLRELLSVKVSELWREPTGKVLLMRITVTEGWVGRKLADLESGLRRPGRLAGPLRRGPAAHGRHRPAGRRPARSSPSPTRSPRRVHEVVEHGPAGGGH